MATKSDIQVIGISGKAETGKDFISQHILLPMGYMRFSLAWHFKVWIAGKGDATYEEVFVTKPPHVRKMLQEEGTERGRNVYGEQVWCDTVRQWMRVWAEHNDVTKFVVPDIRFPNEVDFVRSMGGRVFRLIAPKRAANSKLGAEARQHISETALDSYDKFDGYIYNDPEFSETVHKQVCDLVDEPYSQDGDTGEFTTFDIADKINRLLG